MSEDEFDSAEDDLADKSVFVQSEVRRPTPLPVDCEM
jgi:hypothetical protein